MDSPLTKVQQLETHIHAPRIPDSHFACGETPPILLIASKLGNGIHAMPTNGARDMCWSHQTRTMSEVSIIVSLVLAETKATTGWTEMAVQEDHDCSATRSDSLRGNYQQYSRYCLGRFGYEWGLGAWLVGFRFMFGRCSVVPVFNTDILRT